MLIQAYLLLKEVMSLLSPQDSFDNEWVMLDMLNYKSHLPVPKMVELYREERK
jgi:hypothetical protein